MVRIGRSYLESLPVENGTPQGSIFSPLLFSLLINDDVFKNIVSGMEFSYFAEDGGTWARGKGLDFLVKKVLGAITGKEQWSYKWRFKFPVDETKIMF